MNKILSFYNNKTPNGDGVFLKEMWDFNDWQLENTHHFIQWMFPVELKSNHCDDAPIIDSKEAQRLASDQGFKDSLMKSLIIMENFWGFDVKHSFDPDLVRPRGFKNFMEKDWPTAYNHNFIRISRVLHCLSLFGLETEAKELYSYLECKVYPHYKCLIGEDNFKAWQNAMVVSVKVA